MLPQVDTGNTGFMILCSCLVMLMTPGLALFYGGLVRSKNVLAIMYQSFVSLAWTAVLWFCFGYSMCFGPDVYGIIGNPFTHALLIGINLQSLYLGDASLGIPTLVQVGYQLMFAVITPALITGAFANRVTFIAYLLFLTAWLSFVYFPLVHMVWDPDGILAKWGVLDFAGGIVVHASAGFAALAAVLYIGKRQPIENVPHNIPMAALGAGLLWFGWFGFNSGSEFRVDSVTTSAFINTDLAASFGSITWMVIEWFNVHQPRFIGFLTGAIAGLATITPAAGYVSPEAAAVIGILASVICYYAVELKNHFDLDDALDVWAIHGAGGFIGIVFLGLFANKLWNHVIVANGLLVGGGMSFLFKEFIAVTITALWAFAFTYGVLWLIDRFIPVRVTEEIEKSGLDQGIFGESAYSEKP